MASAPRPVQKTYVKRFPTRALDLRFSVFQGTKLIARGRCTRLNDTGFAAVIAGELPLGQNLSIEFVLAPTKTVVRLMASVRQRQGFLHLFDFSAPGDTQRRMIADFWSEQLHNHLD